MPIPFHDIGDIDELGSAGFLKIEALVADVGRTTGLADVGRTSGLVGGLLTINARGEPLEFAFNRVELSRPALWAEPVARLHLQRRLIASLLSVCSRDPRLLVCLADEIHTDLFERELRVEVPVVLIGPITVAERVIDQTTGEVLAEEAPVVPVAWQPAAPDPDSAERRLFDRLSSHELLLEPFERATLGLREAYAGHATSPR